MCSLIFFLNKLELNIIYIRVFFAQDRGKRVVNSTAYFPKEFDG